MSDFSGTHHAEGNFDLPFDISNYYTVFEYSFDVGIVTRICNACKKLVPEGNIYYHINSHISDIQGSYSIDEDFIKIDNGKQWVHYKCLHCDSHFFGYRNSTKILRLLYEHTNGIYKSIMKESDGMKFDDGKVDMTYIPFKTLESSARIMAKGAEKYAPDNWKKVPDAEHRYKAALARHFAKYMDGQEIDEESGELELGHIICNAMFLIWFKELNNDES
jgi:hypothetical protein